MFKYMGVGLFIMVIAFGNRFYSGDWDLALKIIGISAVVPLLLAGLLTGALVGGDENRANYHAEVKQDKDIKDSWVKKLVFISVPNAIFMLALLIIGISRL